jgi:hypothetical protein
MNSQLSTMNHQACHAPQPKRPDRDAKFLELLPRIRRQAVHHLRHLSGEVRAEAIDEVVASAFVSYVRLTERGKTELAYAGPLARYGAYQYLSGRRVGSRLNRRDVLSEYGKRKTRTTVERLDSFDARQGDWQDIMVEDRRSGPAEVAATRVDFAAWLATLCRRTRQIATDLALGGTSSDVARKYGVTAGRISQLRRELKASWGEFQHEPVLVVAS